MTKTLTIFTPTYNRAYLLPRLYDSLKKQTSHDFIWMVVDDGSTDLTKQLVEKWVNEKFMDIVYIFKENEGMHSAHNVAYENITTPYNVCIDSDDYMPSNAVETITLKTKTIDGNGEYCGLVGLDALENGEIIGTRIPELLGRVKLSELYQVHNVKGDKKLVYKTELIKNAPSYPIFKDEKFVPLDYKYLLLDQTYWLKPFNEVLCIVEYQQDGSTKNILKQYRRNPRGFAFSRMSRIDFGITFKERIKNALHLGSCALFSLDFSLLFKTSRTYLVLSAFPFGILLNLYIRLKTSKIS